MMDPLEPYNMPQFRVFRGTERKPYNMRRTLALLAVVFIVALIVIVSAGGRL